MVEEKGLRCNRQEGEHGRRRLEESRVGRQSSRLSGQWPCYAHVAGTPKTTEEPISMQTHKGLYYELTVAMGQK